MIDDLEDLARRQARAQNGLGPSHARPQPWFVGSGKRLAWLIVALVAVLIALRGVTTLWLAEDASNWWSQRKPATVVARPPVYVPRPVRAGPPPSTITLQAGRRAIRAGGSMLVPIHPPRSGRGKKAAPSRAYRSATMGW